MDNLMVVIIIGVILVAIVLYFILTRVIKNKNIAPKVVSTIDIDTLMDALGGQSNIKTVNSSPSKLTVSLNNQSIVDIKKIQSLGASGIVEGKESLSMIFGKQSSLIAEDLKARK